MENFKTLSVTVEPEMRNKILLEAKKLNTTPSWIVRAILRSYFSKLEG